MTQEELLAIISAHPEGIMQSDLCKQIMSETQSGGYVVTQIFQLKKWKLIRRENVNGKWRLYAT